MEIFDKLEKIKSIERPEILTGGIDIDRSNWLHVFSACVGKVMAILHACDRLVIKNRKGNVDFSRGIVSFGTDEFPLQFIGKESVTNNTWLWGEEDRNLFSDEIVELVKVTRTIGQKWGLEPLASRQLVLDEVMDGRALSIVACGLANDKYCYYKSTHLEGADFVAFSGVPQEVFASIDASRFGTIVSLCTWQYQVDYRIFLESLLFWNGIVYITEGNRIIAHFEEKLCIEFNQMNQSMSIVPMDM